MSEPIDSLVMRFRRTGEPDYTHTYVAWMVRPFECYGPSKPVVLPESRLQELMDRANREFGDPSRVIPNEKPLVKPARRR